MSFHEVRFPTSISFGSVGGPERKTEIVSLANGHEERNSPWTHSRRRFDAGLGVRSLDDLEGLVAFFEARGGQLFGFRWKDWTDFKSTRSSRTISALDQTLGIGDGVKTVFQLLKSYVSGAEAYTRWIRKPVDGSVIIAVDGEEITQSSGWTVDPTTGAVSFDAPPAPGMVVTSGFEFDVPVRFDTESIRLSMVSFQAGEVPDVPVIEVRV